MPGWFVLTVDKYNRTATTKATNAAQRIYLEDTFCLVSNALNYTGRKRYYFADRAPDVSADVLGAEFKAWLDAEVVKKTYIFAPTAAMTAAAPPPPPAVVVHVHASEPVIPPHVEADTRREALIMQIALERERTEEARRQTLMEQALIERDRANREAERAQRELRAAQQDHHNAMRAEMQRTRDEFAAERMELQRMRVENHQHYVQNNMYMAAARPPAGRGAPPPRVRRPPPPSFTEILSLRLAQAVQVAGRILVGNGNAGLNQRQRLLLDKHRGAGPR